MMLAVGFVSCTDADKFDYDKTALFVSGTENNPMVKFVVEDTPASYAVTIQSTSVVEEDVTLTLKVDPSLVAEYNAANGTTFTEIPLSSIELENPTVKMVAGSAISTAATLRVVSTEEFKEGCTYVIPVTIASVSGNNEIIPTAKTIFLRVSRVIQFAAINANYQASSNFVFEKSFPLSTLTYEMKVYPTGLAKKGPQRFLALENADESKALLLRFNEANTDNKLQIKLCGATFMSNTQFQNNQWYLLSVVYDGSTISLYVNGVLDSSIKASFDPFDFQRYEMGMSWTNYPSQQFFSHRFCEIRVWDRALSPSEIVGGMCGVDPQSNGLRCYWKFNEGEGIIFHDATGNGFDMDWSKTKREKQEGAGLVATPEAANYIKWIKDDINKCAN